MTDKENKRLFVIDTDAGIDDAQAIFMALAAEDVTVLALTTVQGNASSGQVARNVLRVLKVANRLDIPVYKGCDRTILGKKSVDSGYHGSDGFGDCPDPDPPNEQLIRNEHAIDALIRLSNEYKDQITLVCLGPLSNIAAVLQRDPEFGSRLKDCYIMGGNYYGRGNITVSAEYNFHCDPEAAFAVLEHLRCPITLVGWELCEDNAFPWSWHEEVYKINSEKVRFISKVENYAIQKYYHPRNDKGLVTEYQFADQLIVACALTPPVVQEYRNVYATVETKGEITRGQMVVDWNNQVSTKNDVYHALRSSNNHMTQFMKTIETKPIGKCHKLKWSKYVPADEVAMSTALRPADVIMETKNVYATVELSGHLTYGQVVIDWNNILEKPPTVTLVTKFNQDKYKHLLFELMTT